MIAEISFLEGSFVIMIPSPESKRTVALVISNLKKETGCSFISKRINGKVAIKPSRRIPNLTVATYEKVATNVGKALRLAGVTECVFGGNAKHYDFT